MHHVNIFKSGLDLVSKRNDNEHKSQIYQYKDLFNIETFLNSTYALYIGVISSIFPTLQQWTLCNTIVTDSPSFQKQ